MSNRTAAADSAIRLAWKREQELVKQGKGTRDWTPEQQANILERGKAYDDDKKAFQGHHMKNVEDYPKYQGNPDNIQFLSKTEHFEAHNGNYQNLTNGYFNPITKKTIDFGDGLIPCKSIDLTNPIVKLPVTEKNDLKHEVENKSKESNKAPPTQESNNNLKTSNVKKDNFIIKGFKKICIGYVNFRTQHPFWSQIIKQAGLTLASIGAKKVISKDNSNNIDETSTQSIKTQSTDIQSVNSDLQVDSTTRKLPNEHMVNTKGQHYHTKNGVEWREVEPYTRGGKKKN